MKNLVVIGNGSYARMMKRYVELTGFGEVQAFVVDAEYVQEKALDGIQVLSFAQFRERFLQEEVELIMGIGYAQMGGIRKRIFEKCKAWNYRFTNYIHPTAIIEKNVQMGEGNNILEGVIIEESVRLGNANLLFGGVLLAHETMIGDYNTFSVRSVVAGCVSIANNCFFGAASTVKDHLIFADCVLVGAGAYVYQNMDAYAVIVPERSRILEGKKSTDYI